MRKWLVLGLMFLAAAGVLRAQSDIQISWKGPFGDLGRGLAVGTAGPGGTNNAFIINMPSPQTQACIYVNNKSGNGTNVILNAFTTNDAQVKGYYSNPLPWVPTNIQGQTFNIDSGVMIRRRPRSLCLRLWKYANRVPAGSQRSGGSAV